MLELQKTLDLISWARQVAGSCVQWPEDGWLDPFWMAVLAGGLGLVLALWGGRMLRSLGVFAFMIAGAMLGKRIAAPLQVDLLIGLVIGAGVAGLIGYLFYRWWLGLTCATAAALLLAVTVSAPRLMEQRPGFEDFRLGVGTGVYSTAVSPEYRWTDFERYFWDQHRDVAIRALGPVVLAGMLGFALAIVAPRTAAMVGTSLLGVTLFAGGAAELIAQRWPAAWAQVQTHQGMAMGFVGFLWLFALMYQTTHPSRPRMVVPVAPVAAPAASN